MQTKALIRLDGKGPGLEASPHSRISPKNAGQLEMNPRLPRDSRSVLHDLPALHHERHFAHRGDVFKRISVDRDEVRLIPRSDGADLVA